MRILEARRNIQVEFHNIEPLIGKFLKLCRKKKKVNGKYWEIMCALTWMFAALKNVGFSKVAKTKSPFWRLPFLDSYAACKRRPCSKLGCSGTFIWAALCAFRITGLYWYPFISSGYKYPKINHLNQWHFIINCFTYGLRRRIVDVFYDSLKWVEFSII